MRASRLLSILMLLQTRGRMSAPALAQQLEVSQRTILRDIDQLSAAGVPVWSDRGRDGGFQLREGWSTQLTGLTGTEAQALFLAGMPGAATELGLGSASASAQLKMLASLPPALRDDAQRVSSRLHVDPLDWFRSVTPPEHLQMVAYAVWNQRIVAVRYESWSSTREHVLRPLGLVLKAGTWYMAAQAAAAGEPRIYRLSNIHGIKLQATTFRRPKKFHLPAFWQAATQRFETEIYRDAATLRVTRRGMKLLEDLSPVVREAAGRSAQADGQDWVRVVIPIESVAHAAKQLLGLGSQLQVLEPAALRDQMRETLRKMSALYAA